MSEEAETNGIEEGTLFGRPVLWSAKKKCFYTLIGDPEQDKRVWDNAKREAREAT
jgi:hypothetical protein